MVSHSDIIQVYSIVLRYIHIIYYANQTIIDETNILSRITNINNIFICDKHPKISLLIYVFIMYSNKINIKFNNK